MHISALKGKWALVTGASQGIGREFCTQLAAHGVNLFMVAREASLLREVSDTLQKKYSVTVFYEAVDLSTPHAPRELHERVHARGVHISLLCNVAAIGKCGEFVTYTPQVYTEMIMLNTTAAVVLAQTFFEDLKAESGVLVNVTSQAALQPVPYMAVYGGTKAFLHSWSLALSEEWRPHGIHVQTLVPSPTRTAFDARAGVDQQVTLKRAEPAEIVSRSLRMLGSKELVVTNVRGMYMQRIFGSAFPIRFVLKKVASIFKPHTPSV